MNLGLRPAVPADAERLLVWRNDPLTRSASLDTGEIALASHREWLARVLADPARRLFIAELDGDPVGSIRLDREGGVTRLSWMLAPEARGRGLGRRMLAAALALVEGPVLAEIKADNLASRRMAEACGLVWGAACDGVLRYERPAEPESA